MKKIILVALLALFSNISKAHIEVIQVWDGYFQFLPATVTIELGDTIHWVPLDDPLMTHTITSTSIPDGAATFDQIWELPDDIFFEYIPTVAGLYNYECTPHAEEFGMIGSFEVTEDPSSALPENTQNEEAIVLYPNPTTTFFYLNDDKIGLPYKIVDVSGNLIEQGVTKKEMNVSKLSKGIYFLNILSDHPRVYQFIKE